MHGTEDHIYYEARSKKIALKKASAGEIIAGLKIVRAEKCRAQAAVVSATRILGIKLRSSFK